MFDPSDGSDALIASTPSGQPGSSELYGLCNTTLQPPPEYYEPEYFIKDISIVVSHGPHLNSDGSFFSLFNGIWLADKSTFNPIGEVLCRFLLSQATSSPTTRIFCCGTHSVSRSIK